MGENHSKLESVENNQKEKQRLMLDNLAVAKNYLKKWFGVEDLTTIEGVYLRRILEQVMREQEEQEKIHVQKVAQLGFNSFNLNTNEIDDSSYEAVTRWLLELYDIDQGVYTNTAGLIKNVDEKFKEHLKFLRERAHFP